MTATRGTLARTVLGAALFVHLTTELFPIGAQSALARQLHTSPSRVGLLLTAYAVAAGVATIPVVRLARRVPPCVALVGAMAVLAIAQVGLALSSSLLPALGLRGLGALGHGLVWSQAPLLGSAIAGPGRRGRGAGSVLAGASMGLVAGAPMASGLVEAVGTRVAAGVLAAAAAVVGIGLWVLLSGSSGMDEQRSGRTGGLGAHRGSVVLVCSITVVVVVGHYVGYANLEPLLARDGWDGARLPVALALFGLSSLVGVALAARTIDAMPRGSVMVTIAVLVVAQLAWVAASGSPVLGAVALWGLAAGALPPVLNTAAIRAGGAAADLASAWYVVAYQVGIAGGAAAGGFSLSAVGAVGTPVAGATILAGALALAAVAWSRLPGRQV